MPLSFFWVHLFTHIFLFDRCHREVTRQQGVVTVLLRNRANGGDTPAC